MDPRVEVRCVPASCARRTSGGNGVARSPDADLLASTFSKCPMTASKSSEVPAERAPEPPRAPRRAPGRRPRLPKPQTQTHTRGRMRGKEGGGAVGAGRVFDGHPYTTSPSLLPPISNSGAPPRLASLQRATATPQPGSGGDDGESRSNGVAGRAGCGVRGCRCARLIRAHRFRPAAPPRGPHGLSPAPSLRAGRGFGLCAPERPAALTTHIPSRGKDGGRGRASRRCHQVGDELRALKAAKAARSSATPSSPSCWRPGCVQGPPPPRASRRPPSSPNVPRRIAPPCRAPLPRPCPLPRPSPTASRSPRQRAPDAPPHPPPRPPPSPLARPPLTPPERRRGRTLDATPRRRRRSRARRRRSAAAG